MDHTLGPPPRVVAAACTTTTPPFLFNMGCCLLCWYLSVYDIPHWQASDNPAAAPSIHPSIHGSMGLIRDAIASAIAPHPPQQHPAPFSPHGELKGEAAPA